MPNPSSYKPSVPFGKAAFRNAELEKTRGGDDRNDPIINGTLVPSGTGVDNIKPSVSVTSPAEGVYFGGTIIQVNGPASDNVAIASVTIRVGTGTYENATFAGNSWSHFATLTNEGLNTINAIAYDTSGNSSNIFSRNVNLDTSEPTATIYNLTEGTSFNNSALNITGAASDTTSGVKSVQLRNNGGSWGSVVGSNVWSKSINLFAGVNILEARAIDRANNISAFATVEVNYDTGLPGIKIMPLGDSITRGEPNTAGGDAGGYRALLSNSLQDRGITFDFVGRATDQHGNAQFNARGDWNHESYSGGFLTFEYQSNVTWTRDLNDALSVNTPDLMIIEIGTNDIFGAEYDAGSMIPAYDLLLGSIWAHDSNISVILSEVIPLGTQTTYNAANTRINNVNGSLAVLVGSKQAAGSSIVLAPVHGSFDAEFDILDGAHPTVTGYQKMADTYETAFDTIVFGSLFPDVTKPIISVQGPANNTVISSNATSITVLGHGYDDRGGTFSAYVKLDSGTWGTATGSRAWSIELDGIGTGAHTIQSKLIDLAGNESDIDTRNFTRNSPVVVSGTGDFVQMESGNLTLNGTIFSFGMNNAYWMMEHQSEGRQNIGTNYESSAVKDTLDACVLANVKVVRQYAFNDDPARVGKLQVAQGSYNEQTFIALDWVLYQLRLRNLKTLMLLCNNWPGDYGARQQYVDWHGGGDDDLFYTATAIKDHYKEYASAIINRTNTYTGTQYFNDTTIMAWSMGQEFRHANDTSGSILLNWYDEMGSYIKSLDPNHLIHTGEEGFDKSDHFGSYTETYTNTWVIGGLGNNGVDGYSFSQNCRLGVLDMAEWHTYPIVFGMTDYGNDHVAYNNDHARIAAGLGKPGIVGEYGRADHNTYQTHIWPGIEAAPNIFGAGLWQLASSSTPWYYRQNNGMQIVYPTDAADFLAFASHNARMNVKFE